MSFAVVGEGKTDHIVLRNLLVGFTGNKNLIVTRPLPEGDEPVGWGNLFNFLASDRFRKIFDFEGHVIVQIDTGTCEDWDENLKHIGTDTEQIGDFIENIKKVLIKKMGEGFYDEQKDRILFAICVHDIECWLLPFNSTLPSHHAKLVGCLNTLEHILNPKGISLHQKNYKEGKHYDDLSKLMKNRKDLTKKAALNASLKIFIDDLLKVFPSVEVSPSDGPETSSSEIKTESE
ncbi:MAG TPA: hypothetical protein VNS58_29090 [Puia sp.]|nr:hypothetical protein [Puia sp.]